MRDKQVEVEVGRLITKLQWKLYNESGFTLEEVGQIFKISPQGIGHKIRKQNYGPMRTTGNYRHLGKVPTWQKKYVKRLISYGLTYEKASDIIGVSLGTHMRKTDRKSISGGSRTFKLDYLNHIWDVFCELLLVKMWNDSATKDEIYEILGYNSKNVLCSKIDRMRKKGVKLDKRRKVKN